MTQHWRGTEEQAGAGPFTVRHSTERLVGWCDSFTAARANQNRKGRTGMVAVLQPVSQGKIIAIDRAVVLVGRSADCDVIVSGSQKISRRHCCLVQVDDSYYVRDLGSMNGVWLNGDRVVRESPMAAGDRLSIGDVEYLFHPNARIEQKKTVTSDASPTAAPAIPAPVPPVVPTEKPQDGREELTDGEVSTSTLRQSGYLDDVIPLDELTGEDEELVETNEVEIIDEPIVDQGDDDYLDEIVVLDDD